MSECKHGLKSGCVYCHGGGGSASTASRNSTTGKKRTSPPSRLADKMNDRMTALKRRLREVRGE